MMKTAFVLFFFLSFFTQIKAQEPPRNPNIKKNSFSLGPGAVYFKSIYKGDDDKFFPIPAMSATLGRFSFNGLGLNYSAYKKERIKDSFSLQLKFSGFSPKRGEYLEGMRKRRTEINIGNSFEYDFRYFSLGGELGADLSDLKGYESKIFLGKRFFYSKSVIFTKVKAVYQSKNRSDEKYAVYSDETRADRPYYRLSETISPGFDLMLIRNFRKSSLFFMFSVVFLDKEIIQSPIVNSSKEIFSVFGYSFKF